MLKIKYYKRRCLIMVFCHKCGAKADDDAIICSNCGERLILDDNEQQTSTQIESQANNIQTNETQSQMNNIQSNESQPRKKKSHKFPIILGIAVFVVVAFIAAIGLSGGETDYIATVKAHKPLASSQSLPYTYNEVFEKYINSPVWKVQKSGEDTAYVDISGTLKGTKIDLVITIKVVPNPDDPDGVLIKRKSITLDGDKYSEEEDVDEFILNMFLAYDQKYDSLADFLSAEYEGENTLYDSLNSNSEANNGDILQVNSNLISGDQIIEIGETKSYNHNDSNLEVTLDYIEFVDEVQNELIGNYMYPEDGNVFLRAAITVKNVDTKAGQLLTAWNTIVYDNTYEFNHFSVEGNFIGIKPLSSPVAGALIFEVPINVIESDKSLVLNINDMMIGEPIISYTIRPDTNSSAGNKADITGSNTYNSGVSDSGMTDSDILYKGIPLRSFFNQPAANVVQSLGWSAGTDRDDDIRLYTVAGDIETAEVENPALLTVNGISLNKNRDGLIGLFGEPTEESNSSGYSMRYEFPYYAINFELGEPNSAAWRVSIYPAY